jgi:Domain of unknown function (DUF5617)
MNQHPVPKDKEESSASSQPNHLIPQHNNVPPIDKAEHRIRQAIAHLVQNNDTVDAKAAIQELFRYYPKLVETIGKDKTVPLAQLIPLAECIFEAWKLLTPAEKRKLLPRPSKDNNRLLCLLYVINGTMAETILGRRCSKLTREFEHYTEAYNSAIRESVLTPKAEPMARCLNRYPKNADHWLNAIAAVLKSGRDGVGFQYLFQCELPLIQVDEEELKCYPATYYGMFFSDSDKERRYTKAIRILKDYTNRFKNLTLHWGRHHTQEVRKFLAQEPAKQSERTLEKLIERLDATLEKLDLDADGSLARRLHFIRGMQQGSASHAAYESDDDAHDEEETKERDPREDYSDERSL